MIAFASTFPAKGLEVPVVPMLEASAGGNGSGNMLWKALPFARAAFRISPLVRTDS